MEDMPLTLSTFPQAIIHVDCDAFFAAVEQAVHPELKGRPVVTGKERGIIACASYEAKALGIKRGVSLRDAQRICPKLVVLPSDYETYSLFSRRMFEVIRRFTPQVEEYSIDEAFADITGLRRVFHMSYEKIAQRMKHDIQAELGITVSIGLSLTKTLAKLASKHRKPDALVAVRGRHVHHFLNQLNLEDVWGFGPNTVQLLKKEGVRNPLDYVMRQEGWSAAKLGKNGRDLWHELRGRVAYPVSSEEKTSYASISKFKTFTPAVSDPEEVYARLVRNVESAFIKLRRHGLRTGKVGISLRHQDFDHDGLEAKLNRSTSSTIEVLPHVRKLFLETWKRNTQYRATGVYLANLEMDNVQQLDLFEDRLKIDRLADVSKVVDTINSKLGKHTVSQATGLHLPDAPKGPRQDVAWRKQALLPGETFRQRIRIPRWNPGKHSANV